MPSAIAADALAATMPITLIASTIDRLSIADLSICQGSARGLDVGYAPEASRKVIRAPRREAGSALPAKL
jgi:hypothetical protein